MRWVTASGTAGTRLAGLRRAGLGFVPQPSGLLNLSAVLVLAGPDYIPPKSIAENGRSFSRRCSEVIERIVPLRERITSEWVLAPPAV